MKSFADSLSVLVFIVVTLAVYFLVEVSFAFIFDVTTQVLRDNVIGAIISAILALLAGCMAADDTRQHLSKQ